jgi:hypothetical protein
MNNLRNKSLFGILRRIKRRLVIFYVDVPLTIDWLVTGRTKTLKEMCQAMHTTRNRKPDRKIQQGTIRSKPEKSNHETAMSSIVVSCPASEGLKELIKELRRQKNKTQRTANSSAMVGQQSPNLLKSKKTRRKKSQPED